MNHPSDALEEQLSELRSMLQDFGLASLESRIYLLLATTGESTARTLAQRLSANRVDVYRSLKTLLRKGMVQVSLGPPSLYSAVPPQEATRALLSEMESDLRHSRMNAKRFVKQVEKETKKIPKADDYLVKGFMFKLIFGRQIYSTHARMVMKAKKEIITIWSAAILETRMDSTLFAYRKARSLGVRIRILTDISSRNAKQARMFGKLAEVRHMPDPPLRYTVIDNKESLLSVVTPTTAISERVSLWTDNEILAKDYVRDFEDKWGLGETLPNRIRSLRAKL